jgi:hypothetical protein
LRVRRLVGRPCPLRAGCSQRRPVPSPANVERVSPCGRGGVVDRGSGSADAAVAIPTTAPRPSDGSFPAAPEPDPANGTEAPGRLGSDATLIRLARSGLARPTTRRDHASLSSSPHQPVRAGSSTEQNTFPVRRVRRLGAQQAVYPRAQWLCGPAQGVAKAWPQTTTIHPLDPSS